MSALWIQVTLRGAWESEFLTSARHAFHELVCLGGPGDPGLFQGSGSQNRCEEETDPMEVIVPIPKPQAPAFLGLDTLVGFDRSLVLVDEMSL